VGTVSNLYIAAVKAQPGRACHDRREFTSNTWIWGQGSPWCNEMIQDEKQQFPREGCVFLRSVMTWFASKST
jgi:hypothetical protein